MSQELHKELEEKIGAQGAKQAVTGQRAYMSLGVITILGLVAMWTINPPQLIDGLWFLVACIVAGYTIKSQMTLARILSSRLKTKVHWYEIPQAKRQHLFNKWLEKVKARAAE